MIVIIGAAAITMARHCGCCDHMRRSIVSWPLDVRPGSCDTGSWTNGRPALIVIDTQRAGTHPTSETSVSTYVHCQYTMSRADSIRTAGCRVRVGFGRVAGVHYLDEGVKEHLAGAVERHAVFLNVGVCFVRIPRGRHRLYRRRTTSLCSTCDPP